MATARQNLYREFMALPEDERIGFCAKHFVLHMEAGWRTDDQEAARKRIEVLRLVVCEDAKMPEVWEAFLAKANEIIKPFIRTPAKRKIVRG